MFINCVVRIACVCSIKVGNEKRILEKKKDSMRKKERKGGGKGGDWD